MSGLAAAMLVPGRDTEAVLAVLAVWRRRSGLPELEAQGWTVGDVVAAGAEAGLPLALDVHGQWWIAGPVVEPLS